MSTLPTDGSSKPTHLMTLVCLPQQQGKLWVVVEGAPQSTMRCQVPLTHSLQINFQACQQRSTDTRRLPHPNQLLFSVKYIVVPIKHKHQLYGMSHGNIACIWTLYKATYTIPVQHTLIHTHWHSVINQSTLQEQDSRFTANMVRLFIQSYGVITVGKA